jgi:hypothetical protein
VVQFGAELLFNHFNQIRSFQPLRITNTQTATIIAAGITTIVSTGLSHTVIKWPKAPTRETIFMGGWFLNFNCHLFLNTNFDDRCVFIIFTIPYLSFCRNVAAKLAIGLSVYVMWAWAIPSAI